jgi:hypothetical protein
LADAATPPLPSAWRQTKPSCDHEEPEKFDFDGYAMNCGEALFKGRKMGNGKKNDTEGAES